MQHVFREIKPGCVEKFDKPFGNAM